LRPYTATCVSTEITEGITPTLLTLLSTVVVETKGLTLEETAALFDGEDAAKHIAGEANTHAHGAHDEKSSDNADSIREHSMPVVSKV